MYTANDIDKMLKDYGTGGASAPSSAAYKPYTSTDINKMLKGYEINPQASMAANRKNLPDYGIDQSTIQSSNAQPKPQLVKSVAQAQQPQVQQPVTQWVPKPGAEKPRVEKGIESIAQTAIAAPVMFGETVAQATRDFAENIQSPDYRAALGKKIKGEILGETDQFGVVRGVSKETNEALKQVSKSTPVSPDALGYQLMGAAKEKQAEAVEGLSPTGQFIGNTLISVGQNAALLPGAVINPALPLAGMGLIAAGDKSYELAQQGVGAGEAALRGTVSAGIETLTEMLPLENLLKIVNTPAGRGTIKTVLKQMGIEGAEETVSYVANYIADKAAADPNAKFSLEDMVQSAAAGALSGGILGGAGAAISRVSAPVTPEAQAIENPAQPEAVQGNILEPLETEIKAKREREMQAGEALRVSGLVNNEAANKVNRRTRRAVDAMAKKLGVKVMFDSTLSGEQGSYDPDNREIHIALDSSDPIGVVMTHEITHRMKETSPEQYEQLKNLAFEIMQENGSYDNVLASVADAYGNDAALIEDEMVAHFTRVMTEDLATFERLAGVDRNLAQKLFDLLDELLRKAGWDNNANVALDSLFGDINPQRLQSVRNSWAQALQNADAGAAGSGARQQSIETLPDGRQYVKADRNIIQGDDPVEWVKQVYNFFDRELRNGYDVVVHSSDGHELIISDDTVGKAVYNKKDGGQTVLTKEEFRRKLEAATHIDQLAEVSKYHKSKPDNPDHPHNDIDGDWKYFTSFFEDSENGKSKYYRVEFSVMPKRKDIIYDITDFQKRKHPTITGSSSNSGGAPSRVLLNDLNITQPNSGVNNHSMESKPLDPNAINRNRDILAPLREGMRRATAPHQPLTGSRQGGESAISHIGEEGAFDDVKTLLASAAREHDRRARAEKERVATIATAEDMKPPRVNVQDVAKASYRKLVDSGERVSQIAKATNDKVLYPLFNNAKQARQTAQYNIGVAQTNLSGERIGKSVQDIVGPIKAKGEAYWNAFQDYVYHMHNIDSMTLDTRGAAVLQGFLDELEEANPILAGITEEEAQELRRQPQYREVAGEWINLYNRIQSIHNKPVFGRSVGAEQSREIAGQYLLNHPEFEDLAAEVVGYYRNIINNNVDAGLISAKERDILQQLYPNYVPVMTLRSGVSINQNDRTARVADVHKRREGNSDLLMPIDEVMARRTLSSVAAQRRNLFGVRLLEQALANRAMVGRDVQSVEDTNIPYDMDAEEVPKLPNGFRVWVDGQPEVMAVSNELMEAVNSIMPKQSDGNLMERFLGKANNAFKKAVTSHNPFFAITNTVKDLQDATFYTEQNLARFFANYGRAYKEMLTNGEMWQLYQAMGGTGNSYFNYGEGVNLPAERRGIVGAATTIKDKVEAINLITEQAPRLSEFISVIEKGGRSYENIQKALLAAADITTNFGRSGELGQKINRSYVPFFNPGVQGADKLRRHIQNNITNKEWASLIGRASLVGILPALLNYLMWKDDEEYNLLPDHVKDNYYVFKGNDGIWYRIPKGRATMPIGNAAQRAGRAIQGEEGAFEGYLKSSLEAVAPNNPFTDNLAAPIIQAANNKAWHGGTIEPQRLQKLEEGQRYDEKTDKLSKLIGGVTNTSPKKINYVLDQYSGVYGDVLLPLMTPQAEGVPLVNRFYTDTVTSNRLANDFYNSLEKSEQAFNTNYNPIDKAEYSALNKAAKTLSEYYAKDREINASDMKDSEKRNQSRELAKERNDFLLKALEEAQAARDTAGKTFSGISDADYALAYIAQKEFTKSKDKKAAVDKAVPHLSMAQKQTLYQAFNIAKSAW